MNRGKCIKRCRLVLKKNRINTLDYNSFNNILHYMDPKSVCYFMQLSKDNFTLMSQSYIKSKPILNLSKLPENSDFFINIFNFKIKYLGELQDIPEKKNINHLIDFNLQKIGKKKTKKNLKKLENVSRITLFSRIKNLSIFSNIDVVDLSYAYPNNIDHNTDLSFFREIKSLNLENWPIKDVNQFWKVKYLNISHNNIVENVEKLGGVYDLKLRKCRLISDVSKLTGNTFLDISWNQNINNVDNLGNTKSLKMTECYFVRDISNLGNVPDLDISRCFGIRDISNLKNNKRLIASGLHISNIKNQSNIEILDLSDCTNITEINKLERTVKKLNISKCTNISFFQNLDFLSEINLDYCTQIIDVSPFRNIKKVSLRYCINLENVNPLENAKEIDLTGCNKVKNIDKLLNVDIINISRCTKIHDISCLVSVKKITIENCNIEDVNLGLLTLCNPDIEISYCNKFF